IPSGEAIEASSVDDADPSSGDSGRRIDLAHNFRSRPEVLHAVNFIFRQIMTETVGELEYDERAMLVHGFPYPEPLARDDDPFAVEMVLLDRSESAAPPPADAETTAAPVAPTSSRPEDTSGGTGA